MSRVVIFGGTGYAGGNIAREASSRGHEVISYTRSAPSEPLEGVEYRTGSLASPEVLATAAADADVLVVAVHGADVDGAPLVSYVPQLIEAARENGARLSFVGGAGSSLVAPDGPRLVDTPDFHEDWKPEALSHAEVLEALRQAPEDLDWFYVSPAALFGSYSPGETTGSYRTGGDVLVTKEDGSSEISGSDFALAYVDEIEKPAHSRQRFTVGH
ncbi:NAD(P)-dependent oxidoreductase [Aeromicrobium duanguangcaii]|uniref:NAD(P)H-binding protein n=1 Tax=Aeromicrobium duanguangcaii TaxID=2968086 RepID=A0ABY5KJB5_9ACTN|nr:NAD(P)H-binding protein [Aeromicrobium duanguangcaii]MCD9153030.1 NAD(P)H-binding protein [Aeromicrobium duanguangcaii]MCL3836974.1 NAD(P)H-binding protein [Aeromicrobium duanguangcaii]UUI69864.1 NAD(P)H-binding protein [Aeromicrobium duanguangcaii]